MMSAKKYVHSKSALANLASATQFVVRPDVTDPDEWFQLRSRVLTHKQLFSMLEAIWPAIVGTEPHKYALIHCLTGPTAGVWFHFLPNDDFEPGCHTVDTF